MFTGLIEEIGTVLAVRRGSASAKITLQAPMIAKDAGIGDSIGINGTCLTVVEQTAESLSFEAVPETLARTSLKGITKGEKVNLERAVAAGQRMGGHFVQGHVDGTCTLKSIRQEDNARVLTLACGSELLRYMVPKGSVALDGISLTLVDVTPSEFTVWIIPHTWEHTCLQYRQRGNLLNVEVDMIARHIEKLLECREQPSGITADKLAAAGFIES